MNTQLNLPEEFRQYYSPTGLRVYRIQKSTRSGKWRVISVKPERAHSSDTLPGSMPTWSRARDTPGEAQMELDAHARTCRLEEFPSRQFWIVP